jgi:uncharacterized protein
MATPPPCPICGKPAAEKTRPFCSLRCAEVDLGRWFGEVYRVEAEPLAEPDAAASGDKA